LETPSNISSVGDYFNVSIYLKNATLTNVPLGVTDVEIKFNFTDIVYGPLGRSSYVRARASKNSWKK
jgi:hypothetical protein